VSVDVNEEYGSNGVWATPTLLYSDTSKRHHPIPPYSHTFLPLYVNP